jgi:hypothetical protein
MALVTAVHSYLEEMFHAARAALLSVDIKGPLSIMARVQGSVMEENFLMEERFKMDDDTLATSLASCSGDIRNAYNGLFRELATDSPAERDDWAEAMKWLAEEHGMVPMYPVEAVEPFSPEEEAELMDTFSGEDQAPHA